MIVTRTCGGKELVANRTFIVAFACMSDLMSLQVGNVCEFLMALIAFMWLSILGVFALPVLIKGFIMFEHPGTVRTFLAEFCCMYLSCMSVQIGGGRKHLLALIAWMFLFTAMVFLAPVCFKRSMILEHLFAFGTFLSFFCLMNVFDVLFQALGGTKYLAALIARNLFFFSPGNTLFRCTCHIDTEITDRFVFGTATTINHSVI